MLRGCLTGRARYYNKKYNRRGYFWGDRFTQLNRPEVYGVAVFNRVKVHDRGGRADFWFTRLNSPLGYSEAVFNWVNLLAYVDLNPIRAGIVKRPEDYRWSSLGYFTRLNAA